VATYNFKLSTLTAQEIASYCAKVDRRDLDECWLWTGATNKRYGMFSLVRDGRGRKHAAHRLAYFLGYGVDPGRLCVCHKCDNPPCCNPNHLFAASQKENIRDASSKGRLQTGDANIMRRCPEFVRRGEKVPQSKLTEAEVIEIRRLYATGLWSLSKLAALFRIEKSNVSLIVNRKTWKHVA